MTGFRDKELSGILEEVGAELSSSVSKKTYMVVVKDIDDDTGKAEKARKLNIPMIEVDDFKKKFMLKSNSNEILKNAPIRPN